MASGSKISQFVELDTLTGDEEGVVAKGGANFKFALRKIAGLVTKTTVGLEEVDNTSDINKPVSQATQTALDDKAAKVHSHTPDQVTGLTEALAAKASLEHTHTEDEVEGLTQSLADKAALHHNHDQSEVNGLADALNGKAPTIHQHTKAQVQGLTDDLNTLTTSLQGKAPSIHNHSTDQIVGLEAYIEQVVSSIGVGDVEVGELQW